MSTTTAGKITIGTPKSKGWCTEQGIDHAWADGSTLTMNPPIQRRFCTNCGQVQHWMPGHWEDHPQR